MAGIRGGNSLTAAILKNSMVSSRVSVQKQV